MDKFDVLLTFFEKYLTGPLVPVVMGVVGGILKDYIRDRFKKSEISVCLVGVTSEKDAENGNQVWKVSLSILNKGNAADTLMKVTLNEGDETEYFNFAKELKYGYLGFRPPQLIEEKQINNIEVVFNKIYSNPAKSIDLVFSSHKKIILPISSDATNLAIFKSCDLAASAAVVKDGEFAFKWFS